MPTTLTSASNKNEISWVNYVRVICIFFVFFLHTESRAHYDFLERNVDVFFRPFFVNAFFIVSGYLLYRKQLHSKESSICVFWEKRGKDYLLNILFKLMIPSVLFSLILFVPKMIIRHQELNCFTLLEQTIGGGTMWFVSALTIAELLIFGILLFRNSSLFLWGAYGITCFVLAILLHKFGFENKPWFYQGGMGAVFFIWVGAVLSKIEQTRVFQLKFIWIILLVCYCIAVYNVDSLVSLEHMKVNLIGIFFSVVSSFILIYLCKNLKANRFINRIGRATIGLYFLSGAIPECVSLIAKHFFEFNSVTFLLVVILSFLLAIALNEILLKYFGFIFDLRKIYSKNKPKCT